VPREGGGRERAGRERGKGEAKESASAHVEAKSIRGSESQRKRGRETQRERGLETRRERGREIQREWARETKKERGRKTKGKGKERGPGMIALIITDLNGIALSHIGLPRRQHLRVWPPVIVHVRACVSV